MWIVQPLEIAGPDGKPSGRWRMTATSDEGGGGPHGRAECSHASAEEAEACAQCDAWVSGCTGFPSRAARADRARQRDLREIDRLKQVYPERF